MEVELAKDAERNVIPLLHKDGRPVRDKETGLPTFQSRIDPKTGKPYLRPVMTWAHREADPSTIKWLLTHQHSDVCRPAC
jgi:hypothetical protein